MEVALAVLHKQNILSSWMQSHSDVGLSRTRKFKVPRAHGIQSTWLHIHYELLLSGSSLHFSEQPHVEAAQETCQLDPDKATMPQSPVLLHTGTTPSYAGHGDRCMITPMLSQYSNHRLINSTSISQERKAKQLAHLQYLSSS